jgi:predicted RNase H-like HicB family nuclease
LEYLVVVEKGKSSYGAYVPDLPGCVAVGETRRDVRKLIREGIQIHIVSFPVKHTVHK